MKAAKIGVALLVVLVLGSVVSPAMAADEVRTNNKMSEKISKNI